MITVGINYHVLPGKQADQGKDNKLSPGDKTLIVQRGDFKFETNKLVLKKGETVTVQVELLAGRVEVKQGDTVLGQAQLPLPPVAKAHQEAWAKHLGVKVETTNSVGVKMILIPPGESQMGSSDEDVALALKIAEETKLDARCVLKMAEEQEVSSPAPFGSEVGESMHRCRKTSSSNCRWNRHPTSALYLLPFVKRFGFTRFGPFSPV